MLIQGGTFILDSRVHYNWPGLDMKTKISERASKYALGKNEMTGDTKIYERALGKNEMTGMTGRPRKIPQGYKYSFSLDLS